MSKLFHAGLKLRSANIDLSQGRVWAAFESYTGVLESEAPGHPYAFLNRSLCLILLGHPALATFDCWRAIKGGEWAKNVEGDHLARCIRRYAAMYTRAKEAGDAWTTGCANSEIAGEEARWLAQPLADLAVRRANHPKDTPADFPQARYVILCGYYRLAYALFKCGGGALQSALNMINVVTERHCVTSHQQDYFLDLQNHILLHMAGIFKDEDQYMVELRDKGLIELPRDRSMMEDNLVRGLMNSTFTTIAREQYPWDIHSVSTDNFDELRPELEQFVQESNPRVRLAAIRSSDEDAVVKGKVPRLYFRTNSAEDGTVPLAFVDENSFFVWSKQIGENFSCEGCGSVLLVDDDWIPPAITRQQNSDVDPGSDANAGRLTPDQDPVPGETESPPAEDAETPRAAMSPPARPGRYYANLNAEGSGAPRPQDSLESHPADPSNDTKPQILEGRKSPQEEYTAPEPGRNAFEERRPSLESLGLSEASGNHSQQLEEARNDSLYSNTANARPGCPPSPRPASRGFSPPRREQSPPLSEPRQNAQRLGNLTIREMREMIKESRKDIEDDLRVCLGANCCVFFCSKECEDRHAPAHDVICDDGIEESLLPVETEQSVKIGGWWGGMVPTIPRQRVLSLLMKKVIASLWVETGCADFEKTCGDEGARNPGVPLEVPWVRLMDGNLDEPSAMPDCDSEEGEMHFVNDVPDGDLQFLFPGYRTGTTRPSSAELAQYKMHKLPFSLDTSVIWPLQVLFELGNASAFFDISRWDGWMLTTLAAKLEATARIDHFCRFSKSISASGMTRETRCIDLPSTVRTNGLRKLQETDPAQAASDKFTDPKLANETELLLGSLHPLTSLIRVADEVEGQPTVRLGDRAGDVFVFKWPVGSPMALDAPLLTADKDTWPFKLLRDHLEVDEFAGIGGRWANVSSSTVERWIRKAYQASTEGDMERELADDSGRLIEDMLAGYRSAVLGLRRGSAAGRPLQSPSDDEDEDGPGGPGGSEPDTVPMEVANACSTVSSSGEQPQGDGSGTSDHVDFNQHDKGSDSTTIDTDNNQQQHDSHGFNPINRPNAGTTVPSANPPSEPHHDLPLRQSDESQAEKEANQVIRGEEDLRIINARLWLFLHGQALNEQEREREHGQNEHQDGYQNGGGSNLGDNPEDGQEEAEEEEEEEEEESRSYLCNDTGDSDSDYDEGRPLLEGSSEVEDSDSGEDADDDSNGDDGGGEGEAEGEGVEQRRRANRAPVGSVNGPPTSPPRASEQSTEDLDLSKLTMYELGH